MSREWEAYAGLARQLDDERATERSRTEGLRVGVAEMSRHADELQARLEAQHEGIIGLSQNLRLRMPSMAAIEPDEHVDPATDLTRVAQAIDRADGEAVKAAARGQRPALLPDVPPLGRALLVYGLAAAVIIMAQAISFFRNGSNTAAPLVLGLIPITCFLIAFGTLKIGSRTRVSPAAPKVYTRMGLLLCFLIGPVVILVVALAVPALR